MNKIKVIIIFIGIICTVKANGIFDVLMTTNCHDSELRNPLCFPEIPVDLFFDQHPFISLVWAVLIQPLCAIVNCFMHIFMEIMELIVALAVILMKLWNWGVSSSSQFKQLLFSIVLLLSGSFCLKLVINK